MAEPIRHLQAIEGRKGKKPKTKAPRTPVEAPNTLQSKQTGRWIDVLSEGPIVGLVDGAQSIFFDETPLENADGSRNFDGVVYETRLGEPDQDALSGFPSSETEVQVGVEVLQATPVTRTITNAELDALRVKIRIPQLTYQDTATGDLVGSSVQLKIEVQPNGGSYSLVDLQNSGNPFTISGKNTSPYEVSYRVPLPAGGAPWNIRVTRLTADSAQSNLQNKTYWSTYTEVIDVKLRYPDTALIGVSVDASLFGSDIPERAYEIKGLKIRVPSNYDPEARAYVGIWDGTFQVAYSNNPAWVLYDLLTNPRYGLGDVIDASQVDKFALYSIGQYCDELVDDGQGGQEPRFVFNGVLNTKREAYDVINAISTSFRGMVYWQSGAVTAVQDAPADAAKLVTPANVINGDFNYSGSALKARHTVALVTWNDPDDGYKAAIEVVEDPDGIAAYGWRQIDTVAFGCTSRGQAHRFGKWILDSERYETETVTYQAALDHADVRPGDIIKIADPAYAGVRMGGRLVSIASNQVVLDQEIEFESDQTYTFTVVLPDGTLADRELTNPAATTNVLTFTQPLDTLPLVGALFVVTASSVEPRLFRVFSVRELEKHLFEISALLVEPASYTSFPSGAVSPPSALGFTEYLYKAGVNIKTAITISWVASPDPRVNAYQVDYKGPNDPEYRLLGTTNGNSIDLLDSVVGLYEFRVRSVDGLGGLRSQGLTASYEARGLSFPPSDVEDFALQIIGGNAYLSWTAVTDLDLAHYVVRFTPSLTGATWSSASVLIPRIDKNATSVAAPAMVGTYLIKAVDESGVESENATSISSNVAAIEGLNFVLTVDEAPDFAGESTDCSASSGVLTLSGDDTVDDWPDVDAVTNWDIGNAGIATVGVYEFANVADLGGIFTSRLTSSITAYGTDLLGNIDQWQNVDSIANWDGSDPSQWDTNLIISYTNDDPSGSPTWTDWQQFHVGDYTARAFRFRLLLSSAQEGISPAVEGLSVTIDMPDRVAKGDNITCTAAGLSVNFNPAFFNRPAIGITAEDMATGDYYVLSSQSATGFTIHFYNSASVAIERTFDWIAKGYGSVSTGLPIAPTVVPGELDFSDSADSHHLALI
jgi:predicted phage tail protein